MSASIQNNQPSTSSDVDSNLSDSLLNYGFTKLLKNYKCLSCKTLVSDKKESSFLTAYCKDHLKTNHKNLIRKPPTYFKKLEAIDLINRKPLTQKQKVKQKSNEKEIFYRICYAIGKTCYPPIVYNDLITDVFKISGQTNSDLLSASNDDIKTGIANIETDIEQRVIDHVRASKYYYLKLVTVRENHVIFVSFFLDNKLYEEVLFWDKDENNAVHFFIFMNTNQIDLEKCLGICYYNETKWMLKIKEGFRTNPIMFIKINLNVFDLMTNITSVKAFKSLIVRINEFKLIGSNFDLLTTDLTNDESELLRSSNHDWLNVSKILRNYYSNRHRFTFMSSTSTSTASGSLSGFEIVFCAFFCGVCTRLEELRNDCNSNDTVYKKAIERIINLIECDTQQIESSIPGNTTFCTLQKLLQTEKLSDSVSSLLKICLKEICNNCKLNYLDETFDWIMDPFAKKNHQSAPEDLGYNLVDLKSDLTLKSQFNAIEDITATNILKFWHDIDNSNYAKLQKLALERLLFAYNTNIYDKINKISFEIKSRKLEDLNLRVKFSQFEPIFNNLPDIFNTNNGEPEQSMVVD